MRCQPIMSSRSSGAAKGVLRGSTRSVGTSATLSVRVTVGWQRTAGLGLHHDNRVPVPRIVGRAVRHGRCVERCVANDIASTSNPSMRRPR